ncbi:GntR family transcriptional regulator [Streptomyces laurentii]|uniref:GntR family transcriptional regulator n=1 Tax=Streptomyces laurentii TaxID=39478 RepID=UPI003699050E
MRRRLRPGDRLVERELAAEFGVSRVPVREAIRMLLGEGLLQSVSPRRIVRMSRNELLVDTLDTLEGRLRWLFRQVEDPGPRGEGQRLLYEAIGAGDAEGAARIALARVRSSRRVALRALFDA